MVTANFIKRYRRYLIWLALCSTVFLIFLVSLPYAIQYGLVKWVEKRGGEDVRIENVDFNPFTGELHVINFRVKDPDGTAGRIGRLSLNLRNVALRRKRIHFSTVEIEDSFLDILQLRDITELVTGGPQQSAKRQPKKPSQWKVGFDGLVIDKMEVVFHPNSGEERIIVERGQMSQLALWMADEPSEIDTTIQTAGGIIKVSGNLRPLANEPKLELKVQVSSLRLDPTLRIIKVPRLAALSGQIDFDLAVRSRTGDMAQWIVDLKGSLGAKEFALRGGNDNTREFALNYEQLDLNDFSAELSVEKGKRIRAMVTAKTALGGIQGSYGQATVNNKKITWDGRISMNFPTAGEFSLDADGAFGSDELALSLPLAGLRVEQRAATWQGKLHYGPGKSKEGSNLSMQAVADLWNISVHSEELKVRLLEFDALAVKGLVLEEDGNFTSDQVIIEKMAGMSPVEDGGIPANPGAIPSSVIHLDAVTVEDIATVGTSRWTAKKVTVDGTSAELERLENGEFKLIGTVLEFVSRLTGEDAKEKPKTTSFAVQEWVVGSDSRLTITDRSVNPPVRVVFTPVAARLEGIDSAQPDRAVPMELQARLGKYTALEMKGTSHPFNERLNLDVTGKLTGFELETVSAYARHNLGYDLTGGRLDADFNAKIIQGRLQSESELTITKLQVEPTNPELLDPLKKRLQVPLETALSLLRDSEDVIRLQIPVTGDMKNPKFDFSGAVNQAIGGAMKKAILTTAKLVFPVGGVIVAMADMGDRLRLEPVRFDPGLTVLTPVARAYLVDVDRLLRERPAVKISICGRATGDDRGVLQKQGGTGAVPEVQQQTAKPAIAGESSGQPAQAVPVPAVLDELLKLARQRAETVKDHMIKAFGVAEERLFLCAPAYDEEPKAVPRAEIVL